MYLLRIATCEERPASFYRSSLLFPENFPYFPRGVDVSSDIKPFDECLVHGSHVFGERDRRIKLGQDKRRARGRRRVEWKGGATTAAAAASGVPMPDHVVKELSQFLGMKLGRPQNVRFQDDVHRDAIRHKGASLDEEGGGLEQPFDSLSVPR